MSPAFQWPLVEHLVFILPESQREKFRDFELYEIF